MKIIIIEDEKLSADHLELLLKKIDPEIEVLARIDSVKNSVQFLQEHSVAELLFVDIHLADGLSFDIFSKVNINIPVIFTTAYDEYAIKAFKINSIDYLLKPIGLEDLKIALQKFKKLNFNQYQNRLEEMNLLYQKIQKPYKNRFLVKLGDSIQSVKTEDIASFIFEDGLVLLITSGGKRYVIDYTLDHLEELLNPDVFFRINRKAMIQINAIQKVSSYFNSRLKLQSTSLSDENAIVSRERVHDFKNWLDK